MAKKAVEADVTDAADAKPAKAKAAKPVKAQSEIGPTTYGDGEPVLHGANDDETKKAYAGGHPSEGISTADESEA